ncbi:MAG TPA: ABC transporter substrate-binding protein [Acidimicrobiia bacterium]|nr:ABC transporter substrate-binding protein [Acidimicrobiia bacterium]
MTGGRKRLGVTMLVLALLGAACGGDDGDDSAGETGGGGATADTIVIGTTDSLQNSFDPAQAYDYFASEVIQNTAETLVSYEPNAVEPSPRLAARMPDVSPDGLEYTFELRPGMKFHDGTAVNSQAVKFSLLRAKEFGAVDPEAAGVLLAGIKAIATPSPTTVKILLDRPNVTFLSRLAYSVASIVSVAAYRDHVLQAADTPGPAVASRYKTDTVVGTGPYKLVSYKEKESLDFEANPDYWGDAPKTKRIRVRLFDRSSALKLALQNKEVDIAFRTLQPDENAAFKDRPGFKLVEGEGPGIRYITFNVQSEPWNKVDMRRALAAAVDRDAVVAEVFKGTAKALLSMVPPTFPTHEPKWEELYPSSAVEKHLAAAGVPAGEKVKVDFWYSPTHYGDTEAAVAEIIARSLEATGRFDVEVSNVEWADYGKKRAAGEMPVFLMGWYPDYLDADDYLEPFANPKIFDPAKWEDPRMLELVAAEQAELDPARRAAAIKAAQAYMAEQAPYVPVFQISQFAATTEAISGVVLDPIQIFRYWLLEKRA